METIVRARRPVRLPVVLSRGEVAALLSRLHGSAWLLASLMYTHVLNRGGVACGVRWMKFGGGQPR